MEKEVDLPARLSLLISMSRLLCELATGLIFISFCTALVVQKAQLTNLHVPHTWAAAVIRP